MPKAKHTELVAWRQAHFGELETTLTVLKGIRDDPEASHKDRIEASKSISRLLSAMSPARVNAPVVKKQEHKPDPEEREEIEKRLAA
jgi:hypothetical protein